MTMHENKMKEFCVEKWVVKLDQFLQDGLHVLQASWEADLGNL